MCRRIVQVLATAACVIVPTGLQAQDTIEPDRPDVTNGTHIVDIGLLQFEVGTVYTRAGRTQHGFASPITGRVGLTD